MDVTFSGEELERYARQIALPQLGQEGQQKLKQGRVLVIGAGGLGSPVLLYLAAAGVGHISVADADNVDLSNLQRQVIHDMSRLGGPKVESAVARMLDINPSVNYHQIPHRINADNIEEEVAKYDFVIDATDNYESKFLINDACVKAGVALSFGGIRQFAGQMMTIAPGHANLRDVFESEPEKETVVAGPFGAVAGTIGTLQATEAIKWIAGIGEPLVDTLLTYDALTMSINRVNVKVKKQM